MVSIGSFWRADSAISALRQSLMREGAPSGWAVTAGCQVKMTAPLVPDFCVMRMLRYLTLCSQLASTLLSPHSRTVNSGSRNFSGAMPACWGRLVHVTHDGSEAAAPTKTLLDLLGASWTGESIDCRDASGALVVTDPANGTHGPRATLVRRDKLESALRRSGLVVTVGIRVSEFGSRILVNRPQVSVVQIDGSSQIEA